MTFGAPLFLIALLAGLIPVLLHMINRHQAKQMPFSTLRFLRLSNERTRRRKYLHDLLLLLLRLAALALIAIGLAQPTVRRLGNFFGGNSRTAVVIVLDNSMSMSTIDDKESRWQQATSVVENLLGQLGDNDPAALLVTCGPSRTATARLYENHDNIRQMLDDLQVSHGQADLATGLKQARALLYASDADNKEIYVITDMQANAWSGLRAQPTITDETAEDLPVIAVDLRGQPGPNVALA